MKCRYYPMHQLDPRTLCLNIFWYKFIMKLAFRSFSLLDWIKWNCIKKKLLLAANLRKFMQICFLSFLSNDDIITFYNIIDAMINQSICNVIFWRLICNFHDIQLCERKILLWRCTLILHSNHRLACNTLYLDLCFISFY